MLSWGWEHSMYGRLTNPATDFRDELPLSAALKRANIAMGGRSPKYPTYRLIHLSFLPRFHAIRVMWWWPALPPRFIYMGTVFEVLIGWGIGRQTDWASGSDTRIDLIPHCEIKCVAAREKGAWNHKGGGGGRAILYPPFNQAESSWWHWLIPTWSTTAMIPVDLVWLSSSI